MARPTGPQGGDVQTNMTGNEEYGRRSTHDCARLPCSQRETSSRRRITCSDTASSPINQILDLYLGRSSVEGGPRSGRIQVIPARAGDAGKLCRPVVTTPSYHTRRRLGVRAQRRAAGQFERRREQRADEHSQRRAASGGGSANSGTSENARFGLQNGSLAMRSDHLRRK